MKRFGCAILVTASIIGGVVFMFLLMMFIDKVFL